MANFLKFRVTDKVGDKQFGLGGLGVFRAGQIVTCTSDQARRWIRTRDIADGFIEPMGENDGAEWSPNIRKYIDGVPGFTWNTVPVSEVQLVTAATPDTQGVDLAGNLTIDRRVAVDKFLMVQGTASGDEVLPIILASSGAPMTLNAANVIGYDNSQNSYHPQANNTISANITGTTPWAAGDLVIFGATEKFSSAIWTIGTAATAGSLFSALYWNGQAWAEFPAFADLTREAAAGGSLGRADDNTRTIWWEKPVDWHVGGPASSGCLDDVYYVALKTNGALTTLAGAVPYPCLDTPLAVISLGSQAKVADALVSLIDDVVVDATNATAALLGMDDTGDYIYVASSSVFGGASLDIGAANANASILSGEYWNGRKWVAVSITDGTASGGATLAQDGDVKLGAIPFDWVPVSASADLGFVPPVSLNTQKLYWLRFSVSAALSDATTISTAWAMPPVGAWHEVNAYPNSFVEAGDPIKLFVNDEDNTADGLTIKAIVMDV
jgi:hypothetical protein